MGSQSLIETAYGLTNEDIIENLSTIIDKNEFVSMARNVFYAEDMDINMEQNSLHVHFADALNGTKRRVEIKIR